MSDWDDREKQKEPKEVIIQDRRHMRGENDDAEISEETTAADVHEPEPEPEPAVSVPVEPSGTEPVGPAPGEVVEFRQPDRSGEPEPVPQQPEDGPPPSQSPEEAQLRMLFEMGITGYLQGQMQLLLTFAVIYLGHQPNPATGLVSADLNRARLAIDMLEFIVLRTQSEMSPEESANLVKIISELKMSCAQVAQQAPVPDPGNGN